MKKIIPALLCAILLFSLPLPAAAGSWILDQTGWWYDFGDGTWPAGTWLWIDGNKDGLAECYYFKEDGYLLTGAISPDGFYVDADGAWIDDGHVVRRQAADPRITSLTGTLPFSPDGIYEASDGRIIHVMSISSHSVRCEFSDREDDLVSRRETFSVNGESRYLYAPRYDRDHNVTGEIRLWLNDNGNSLWAETLDTEGNNVWNLINGIYRR